MKRILDLQDAKEVIKLYKQENKVIKKALRKIKKYAEEQNLKIDHTALGVLEIIDEVKYV